MESMQASIKEIAEQNTNQTTATFCSNVVQIKFNAWHYVDTNLWASLVSYILEELVDYVTDQATPEEQKAALLLELSRTQTAVEKAEADKQNTLLSIEDNEKLLQNLQTQRQTKEFHWQTCAPQTSRQFSNRTKD